MNLPNKEKVRGATSDVREIRLYALVGRHMVDCVYYRLHCQRALANKAKGKGQKAIFFYRHWAAYYFFALSLRKYQTTSSFQQVRSKSPVLGRIRWGSSLLLTRGDLSAYSRLPSVGMSTFSLINTSRSL